MDKRFLTGDDRTAAQKAADFMRSNEGKSKNPLETLLIIVGIIIGAILLFFAGIALFGFLFIVHFGMIGGIAANVVVFGLIIYWVVSVCRKTGRLWSVVIPVCLGISVLGWVFFFWTEQNYPELLNQKTIAEAALAEIIPGKVNMEVAITEGKIPTFYSRFTDRQHIYMGIGDNHNITSHATTTKTTYCGVEIFTKRDGSAAIACNLGKGSEPINDERLVGQLIVLLRDTEGSWSCVSTLEETFRPTKCDPIKGSSSKTSSEIKQQQTTPAHEPSHVIESSPSPTPIEIETQPQKITETDYIAESRAAESVVVEFRNMLNRGEHLDASKKYMLDFNEYVNSLNSAELTNFLDEIKTADENNLAWIRKECRVGRANVLVDTENETKILGEQALVWIQITCPNGRSILKEKYELQKKDGKWQISSQENL